jgi:putative thioredoxin
MQVNSMGTSIVVNQADFNQSVLEASTEMPILVDFYATWCGPCQLLKPLLEKLCQEYNFTLAKVDIDQNPELAQRYGVSGVPDVRIVVGGEVQPGFVGMMEERELRELLQRLQLTSALDRELEDIYSIASDGDVPAGIARMEMLLKANPDNAGLVLEAANFYMEADEPEKAETLLGRISQKDKALAAKARGLQALIVFRQVAKGEALSDLDRVYQQAAQHVLDQAYEAALQGFLAIVSRDRIYRQDAGRRGMIAVFDLLGNDDPLTLTYRKKLTMAMY